MAAYVTKKSSWLRYLVSFLPAAGTAVLLCILLAGPRLGPLYDFLLRQRPTPEISPELLIIDSTVPGPDLGDDILEPGAASSLLYTMTELGAETLIIQVPILGLSAGGSAGEAEILYRFDEEFSLLSGNIRNLFDGIRTGSVAPSESARYVGELVELSEKGKERLVSSLVRRDESGIAAMEKAAAIFGHARRPGDLRVQLIRTGHGEYPGVLMERDEYSRVSSDRDGVLRRIAPVLAVPVLTEGEAGEKDLEHIIYGALKARYSYSDIEYHDAPGVKHQPSLVFRNGQDRIIPLDRNGMVLFEIPHNGGDFRHIGISEFLSYDEADKKVRRLLLEGESLGIFEDIDGENIPGFLYDYALSVRDELVPSSDYRNEERKYAWIEARNRYFSSLEEFLYGQAEMDLVSGYERIIASELMDEGQIIKMIEMRDSLIRFFVELRTEYTALAELRAKLESALSHSFCMLGKRSAQTPQEQLIWFNFFSDFPKAFFRFIGSAFHYPNPADVEASALLANSILTGRAIRSGSESQLFLCSILAAFLACFLVKSLGPAGTAGIGIFIALFAGAGFSLSFVLSGLWLDPLVPAASCLAGIIASFAWALIAKGRYARRFRLAFGPSVSRSCLRALIRAGKPLPSQSITVRTAVAAVKNAGLAGTLDSPGPYARAVLAYQEKAAALFRKAGATIIGADGDLITVSFGSPLERIFQGGKHNITPFEDNIHALAAPAMRAVDIVNEIAKHPDCASWNFGIDLGKCTFAWNPVSGYSALGIPVQRARILSRLAARYKARIVISSAINEALPDLAVKKLDTMKESNGASEVPFYKMTVGN